jgi:deazaflavin-dependent oxidoreductase (nitroreductase family)
MSARKRKVSTFVSAKLLNPAVRRLAIRGWAPGVALLETIGRRSGKPRVVPVGNGLRGEHFWIVTEHGSEAGYVRNLQADPRVRVNVGGRWRAGTAHILPDDDPRARLRELRRPLNDTVLLAVGTRQLVIRVDLDR